MTNGVARILFASASALVLGALPLSAAAGRPPSRAQEEAELAALDLADEAAVRNLSAAELAELAGFEGARLAYLVRVAERPYVGGSKVVGVALPLPGRARAPLTQALEKIMFAPRARRNDRKWAAELLRKYGQPALTAATIVGFGRPSAAFTEAWEASGRSVLYHENVGEYYFVRRGEPGGLRAKVRYLMGRYQSGRNEFVLYVRFWDLGMPARDYIAELLLDQVHDKDPQAAHTAEIAVDFLAHMGDARAAEIPIDWLPKKSGMIPLARAIRDTRWRHRRNPVAHRAWSFLMSTSYYPPSLRTGQLE